ncbi:ABC transporter substrate-binding protein [Arcobacter sp. FW59]|nr:ABC transporter substrate-binding protein [Arcobacter sp. FW59]
MKKFILFLLFFNSLLFAQKQYFLTLSDKAKYKSDFKYFDYINPNAPKGGVFKASAIGTFNSFNQFVLKGTQAAGLGMIYDSLMTPSSDEPFTYYPLIAEAVEVSPKNDWVKFYINKNAKFHDGVSITAEDVKFSFETLIDKGNPIYKKYYADVKKIVILDKHTILFNFKVADNLELPLILGQLQILPKHFWKDKDFLNSDNIVPLGSGAYKVESYEFGKYIKYSLVEDYWAKDLNVNVGMNNFGKIQYDYYKDRSVILEAFKAAEFDYIVENTAKNWATLYNGDKFDSKKIIKKEFTSEKAQGMQGFVFNLRNSLFADIEVRKAINLAFDFEWTNEKLFYNQYKRLNSYFANSELSANGLPSSKELALLEPFKNELPKEVFEDSFKSNITKGDGNIRKELKEASEILKKQGWQFESGALVKDGKKFQFEILLGSSSMEKVLNPFIKNLEKIGIIAKVRVIDEVAYANKLKNFDYDMTLRNFKVSLSPGNEQRNYWGSEASDIIGSNNYIGIKSPAIDSLINHIINAKNREDLIISVRALDRVLTHSYYVIPNWYTPTTRVAYWSKLRQPDIIPKYGINIFSWWIEENELNR